VGGGGRGEVGGGGGEGGGGERWGGGGGGGERGGGRKNRQIGVIVGEAVRNGRALGISGPDVCGQRDGGNILVTEHRCER